MVRKNECKYPIEPGGGDGICLSLYAVVCPSDDPYMKLLDFSQFLVADAPIIFSFCSDI